MSLRICTASVLVGLLCLHVLADDKDDKNAADGKALAGGWKLTSINYDGDNRDVPGDDGAFVKFKDGKLLIKDVEAFSYKFDATTDPKIIDFTNLTEENKGQVLEGIYKVDGDTLTICLWSGMGTKSRPAIFEAKPGTGHVLVVLKRT
jgi:uncharacterized protein (TIGR03067 family)